MVRNLRKAGYEVAIYTRTKAKAEDGIAEGAVWCDTAAECAKGRDVVITIVGYPKDVEEVYFGDNGIIANAAPGPYVIDMTPTSPRLAVRIWEEAEKAGEGDYIQAEESADGKNVFEIPVEALDKGIDCAAYSKKKETWYDRTLVVRASSLPMEAYKEGNMKTVESLGLEDGTYTVEVKLEGGSGRTTVETPTQLKIQDGKATAVITWGSSHYDYMKVGEEKYEPVNTEGNSSFEIPVTVFDQKQKVIADTTAMSVPHEIDYTLIFDSESIQPQ